MLPPILLDQGLPWQVAAGLRTLGLDVTAIGEEGAPPEGSEDLANIEWCAQRGAVLVTNDRGRKDKTIVTHLNTHRVGAVFVYKDLRAAEPYELARALLNASEHLAELVARSHGRVHHRLKRKGRLEPR